MSVSIPCKEIGGGCEEAILGGSLDELVEVAAAHATEAHGLSGEDARTDVVLAEIRS